ncbi:DUF4349 domain-containing protein [Moheibacter sediminis]|uniref:DUF4349 domain-containing protein n=1 Tax=Moheibacter sediminis TaxID=1434700 RepID=A0A1W1ZYM3_9FLAO|nr:DUF4349 domain-containing protein [Moheibacter sediminis]SMC53158.1 protein of unknown function [Moheibacter sediminis]
MKKSRIILPVAFLFIMFSCEQRGGYEESGYSGGEPAVESISIDSAAGNSEIPLSSTVATYQDPERKFIRTADLSMEVENVYKSTTTIEKNLAEIGGFVTQSNLTSNIISTETFAVDTDSAKEVKKYSVQNSMTVRVPQMQLGNFLNSLSSEMKFLNFRNIAAEDVSLSFIMSGLEKGRLDKTSGKLDKITDESGRISDKQNIVNDVDEKQSQINHHKISTMKMKDNVAYSSVTLFLTEKEKIAETMIINPKSYDQKYRTGFWYRAENSIQDGFYFSQTLLVGLLYLWPLWIFACLLFVGIKWYNKKMRMS